MYSFSIAAITYHHTFNCLGQDKCIESQFCGSEVHCRCPCTKIEVSAVVCSSCNCWAEAISCSFRILVNPVPCSWRTHVPVFLLAASLELFPGSKGPPYFLVSGFLPLSLKLNPSHTSVLSCLFFHCICLPSASSSVRSL
jgi:hypothetical protein